VNKFGIKNLKLPSIKGLGLFARTAKLFDFYQAISLFRKSKKICINISKKRNFDLIEATSNRGIAYGASMVKKRPPIFTRVSTTMNQVFKEYDELPDLNYRLVARFEISQIKRSDFLVTHTQNHAKIISKDIGINASRFSIIPHAIPFSENSNWNFKKDADDNNIRVLFVGRLEPRKGFDILISAIPKIVKFHKNVIFDICGSGDHHMFHLEPNIQEKVFFHGYQSRESLEQFYQNCDIFVAPSRYESFGIIYLEAMKYGKPIIGCNSGGTPEVIQNKISGILIEPGNVESLVKAINQLIVEPNYRTKLGIEARKRLGECFSIKQLVGATLNNYETGLKIFKESKN